jgi:hypothetical protein
MEGRETASGGVGVVPQENLTSVRLVPESVLGLKQLKRGYVAKYKQGQAFIVLEDSPESAAAVLEESCARDLTALSGAGWGRGVSDQGAVSGRYLHLSQRALSLGATQTCPKLRMPPPRLSSLLPGYLEGPNANAMPDAS